MKQKLYSQGIKDVFSSLNKISEKYNITYTLDAGSLLKVVRDKSILPASDIDLAFDSKNINEIIELIGELRKLKYKVVAFGNLPFLIDGFKLYPPESIQLPVSHIDCYIYHNVNNEYVRFNIHKPFKGSYLSKTLFKYLSHFYINKEKVKKNILSLIFYDFFGKAVIIITSFFYFRYATSIWFVLIDSYFNYVDKKKIDSVTFPIPVNANIHLEYRYGPNWIKKDPKWRLSDGKCIRLRNLRPAKKYFLNTKYFKNDIICEKKIFNNFKRGQTKIFEFSDHEVKKILSRDQ
tara:strand:+ start:108 stop:980 length:873 start_codon:yes stop_codon:yes gene_type:complete